MIPAAARDGRPAVPKGDVHLRHQGAGDVFDTEKFARPVVLHSVGAGMFLGGLNGLTAFGPRARVAALEAIREELCCGPCREHKG